MERILHDVEFSKDGSIISYKDMYGNYQELKSKRCGEKGLKEGINTLPPEDMLQILADAFRYAVDRNDGGEAREIINEKTDSYLKPSFDDYDKLKNAGVASEVLKKVADDMVLLITRLRPHTAEAGNTTAESILKDIGEELKQPPKWEVEQKSEDDYCR